MKNTVFILSAITIVISQWACGEKPRTFEKISDHVWSYTGVSPMIPANSFGANAGIVIGNKAVLVVDTLTSAKEGKQLHNEIRKVTQLPIRWVVNTHNHFDHSWGNCIFDALGAVIISAEPGPSLQAESGAEGLQNYAQYGLTEEDIEDTTIAPPTVSFTGTMTLDLGGITVQLRAMPHGHCQDNLLVWISEDKTLFAGDLMFVKAHPFVGEGDIPNWLANLDTITSLNAKKIIPGHGPIAGNKDVREMKEYLKTFDKNARNLIRGKNQSELEEVAEKLQAKLPNQDRNDLANMIPYSLMMKYLPESTN